MNKFMKSILASILLTGVIQAKEINSISEAIDISGKQRMYTQRMLRDYVMIGMKNDYKNPDKDLKKIMDDFQNSLDSLIKFNNDEKTEVALLKVKELWAPVQEELMREPTKENAKRLQEDLEDLLTKSNRAVILFTKQTNEPSGEIINISGRQRMLSQRLAALYLLKAWGISDSKFEIRMNETMDLYKKSLETLKSSDLNTESTKTLLADAEKCFTFLEIMNQSKSTFIPTLIFKKSDQMLNDMDKATKEYTKIQK